MDFAAKGQELTFAFPGNALRYWDQALGLLVRLPTEEFAVQILDWSQPGSNGCGLEVVSSAAYGSTFAEVPIAVADVEGPSLSDTLVQTLEPATLKWVRSSKTVVLSEEPRVDSGLRVFQLTAETGLSCASCHPLGRSDAHTWDFSRAGPRRTQPLEGGVSQRGALHWDAEFANLEQLIDDVLVVRMGLSVPVPQDHKDALRIFLDSLPAPTMDRDEDSLAVARGRALFEADETECALCHSGEALTNHAIYDVGTGGRFVTPSLLGVAGRLPLMHDGCARTLKERFGICGGSRHGSTAQLTPAQIDDLVSYLGSL